MEPVRTRGRPRSFDPDAALRRALIAFWEHGYEGASIAVLQEATGLTAPALYRAFGSKERLFELAVRRYQAEFGLAVRTDLPVLDALVDYLDRAAREFPEEPGRGCLVTTGLLASGENAEAAAQLVRAERQQALARLREMISAGIAQGELAPDTDADALARSIGALIQGMSVQARDGAGREDLEKIAMAAEVLLRAAAPPPEPAA